MKDEKKNDNPAQEKIMYIKIFTPNRIPIDVTSQLSILHSLLQFRDGESNGLLRHSCIKTGD